MATPNKNKRGGLGAMLPDLKEAVENPVQDDAAKPLTPSIEEQLQAGAGEEPRPVEERRVPTPVRRVVAAPRTNFQDFERKETRLRQDQLDSLDSLTKRIKRAKTSPGERVTDNTLIRVAVDLLLARGADLNGSTEEELRKSVGL